MIALLEGLVRAPLHVSRPPADLASHVAVGIARGLFGQLSGSHGFGGHGGIKWSFSIVESSKRAPLAVVPESVLPPCCAGALPGSASRPAGSRQRCRPDTFSSSARSAATAGASRCPRPVRGSCPSR